MNHRLMPFYISSVLDFNDAILIYKGEKLAGNGFVSRKDKAFPVTARGAHPSLSPRQHAGQIAALLPSRAPRYSRSNIPVIRLSTQPYCR